ncbi:hypothetical protein Tco_0362116, partial [Tanacetum coccineum]
MSLFKQDLLYLKNGNSEIRKYLLSNARYVVDHWKRLWAKKSHIIRQLKKIDDPEEVYSEKRIVDIIRVQFDQGYGQEYMKE